jgi:peptide/nickel transport system ATP-binding protein
MYAGRIVEEAAVGELFADPKHPYTRGLMASIPGGAPGTRLRAIQGTVPPLGELPTGCSFTPRCPNRFEPCPKAFPGTTVFAAAEGVESRTADGSRIPDPGSPYDHTVKCYLYSVAVEPDVHEAPHR